MTAHVEGRWTGEGGGLVGPNGRGGWVEPNGLPGG
jgi:hypothetical protein